MKTFYGARVVALVEIHHAQNPSGGQKVPAKRCANKRTPVTLLLRADCSLVKVPAVNVNTPTMWDSVAYISSREDLCTPGKPPALTVA
jgi:hypothetical protein